MSIQFQCLIESMVALRREADTKIKLRIQHKPLDRIGVDALRARKNGIQACITTAVRFSKL